MLVDLINHEKPEGATENTVSDRFIETGRPDLLPGAHIVPEDRDGIQAIVSRRVWSLDGRPIEGALLDVWQADSKELYDSQYPSGEMTGRGRFRIDRYGQFLLRTIRAVHYPIPSDGPVGGMLRATARSEWGSAHIHFLISADGYGPVTTQIFDASDE